MELLEGMLHHMMQKVTKGRNASQRDEMTLFQK